MSSSAVNPLPSPLRRGLWLALALMALWIAYRGLDARFAAQRWVGEAAPLVATRTLDGEVWSLADARGRVVVLDFWATWCGPCISALPRLIALQEEFGANEDFLLAGLSFDADRQRLEQVIVDRGLTWLQLHEGENSALGAAAEVRRIPTLWVIDRQGVVRAVNPGKRKLRRLVERLLAES